MSRSGRVPEGLRDAGPGRVLMATCQAATALDEACDILGGEHVLQLGGHRVDLARLKADLADRGFARVLCEGGPHLLRDLLIEEVLDELDTTVVPRLVAGGRTPGSPTARPSTYPSSWRCFSRRSTRCSGGGSSVVTIEHSVFTGET